MSVPAPDPILQAIVRSAVDATGAAGGWLLRASGSVLRVEAAAGDDPDVVGVTVDTDSTTAGYVASSGQPLAISPGPGGPRLAEGAVRLVGGAPASVVSVPCTTEAVVIGVLELFDKAGGGNFSFDDIELATLLAGIAAEGLAHAEGAQAEVADPAYLGGELARLHAADPNRYAAVATVVSALLAHG